MKPTKAYAPLATMDDDLEMAEDSVDSSRTMPTSTGTDRNSSLSQEAAANTDQASSPPQEWKINFNQKIPRERSKPDMASSSLSRAALGFPGLGRRCDVGSHHDDLNDIIPIDFSTRGCSPKASEGPGDVLGGATYYRVPSYSEQCLEAEFHAMQEEEEEDPLQDSKTRFQQVAGKATALMAFKHTEADLPDVDATDCVPTRVTQHEGGSFDNFFGRTNDDHPRQQFPQQPETNLGLSSLDPLQDQYFHTTYEIPDSHLQRGTASASDTTVLTTNVRESPSQNSITGKRRSRYSTDVGETEEPAPQSVDNEAFTQSVRTYGEISPGFRSADHNDLIMSGNQLMETTLDKMTGQRGEESAEYCDSDRDDPATHYKDDTGSSGHDDVASNMALFLQGRNRKRRRVNRARMVAVLLKYCLFILNFIFWVTSVAAIVVGAWVLTERGQLVRDSAAFFLDPSAMACLVGAVTFVVAFIGCLGALRENICLLKMFQLSMVCVLVLEALIAATVFAFYAMPEVRKHIKSGPEEVLKMAIRRYHDDDKLQRWVDLLQTEFRCCGASLSDAGYMDWTENAYFNCTAGNPSALRCAVPRSCCIIERGEYINYMCGYDSINKKPTELRDRIYTQGCMKGLGKWLSSHDVFIGAVCLGILIPQVICVVFARLLIQHIQRQRVRWRALHSGK